MGNGATETTSSGSLSYTYTSGGTYTVSVYVEDSSGVDSNTLTMSTTVDSDPSISISSSINPSDAGQTGDFSTSVSGGTGSYTSYSYVLYDGTSTSDSQLASGSTSSFSYTFGSSGQFLLDYSVTDSNGFTSSTSLTQTVYPDPQAYLLNDMTPGVFYVYSYTSGPTEGAVPYSDISSYPLSMPDSLPNNVSTWAGTFNDGGFGYDYGNPGYSGDTYLGRPVEPYPSSLGVLNTEPGGGAYDEGYMAVTVLYFSAGTYTFYGEYDDNGAMFISNNGVDWTSIIGSSAWIPEGATEYSGTETLSAGWYFFAVDNGNMGGGPSMSALNITGGSISTSGTPPIVSTTDSGVKQFFLTAVMGGTGSGYTYSLTGTGTTYTTPAFNATLSSGSYTEDLTATDAAGKPASASATETVNSDPTVSASSNVSSADVGYPIEFSSSPSGGTSPYTYSWTIGGSQVSTSQDFSYSFSSAGSYTVEVTVTDSIGETYSASVTVTINNNPSVSISSNQNPTDVGNSVTFTASESGGTGTISYAWYINGASEGSGSTLDYSFSSAGSYTVEVIVTDSDGHIASYSITETVYSDPSVTISSSQNPTDVGNSVTFTASPAGGSGSYTYQWYLNGNAFSGATSSTYTTSFSFSGTEEIYVVIKDSVGNSAQSSTLDETVNADPSVSITSSQNPTDAGNSVTFTATGSGGTGSYTYQWYLNGAAASGITSSTYTTSFSSSGSESIYVVLTDGIGNMATSSTITETVNPDPTVSVSSSQNPTDVGNSVTFTASASGGTGSFSYTWYLNGATQTASTDQFDYTFSSAGVYYINVTVKDSLGNIASYSLKETVNPDPSVTVSSSPAPTDAGVPVTFSSSPSGGTSPYNYTWEINSVVASYSASFSYTFTSSGIYTVLLTLRDSNGNTATAKLNETVNADPTVTISPEYTSIDQGINDTFTANVNGGTYPFNYTWYVGSTIVNYSQSFHYAFAYTGTYNVKVTVKDSLGENSSTSVTITSITKPSASVNGPDSTDVNTPTTFAGNATYGTAPYTFYWAINGVNETSASSGLYLTFSFPSVGTYNVSLKAVDSQGSSANAYLNVKVNAKPTAAITASESKGDEGLTDLFSSSVSGGTAPFTYDWKISGTSVGSEPNLTYTFNSEGTILVELTVTDAAGNSYITETNVTINAPPVVSISAKDLSIDQGISDLFNATGSYGTVPYNFTWYIGSSIAGYGPSLSYTFTSAGSYYMKVVLRDADGDTASSQVTVDVFAPPTVSILPTYNSTDAGGTITFLGGYQDGVGPYNYTWTVDGGIASYSLDFSYTFTNAGSYYVNLTVTDAFGETGMDSITIIVYARPSVSVTREYTAIDAGQSDTLTPEITGGHEPYRYAWDISGIGVVSTQQALTYVFSSPGTYSITLTVTDEFGNSANATVSVVVNPSLTARVNVAFPTVDENIIDNITLTAANGTSPYTYSISIDGTMASSSSSYSRYFTTPGTYDVVAYVNDSRGESIVLRSTITVRANPSVYIVAPTNTTDANVPIQFRGILSGGTGPYNYSWLIGGHSYSNATLTHSFSTAGSYDVQLTVTDAFGRETISSINETVHSDPSATLVAPSYIRASQENSLSLNITGGIAPYAVQWYFPSGEQFSGRNITHAFTNAGPETFQAKITDSTGFVDTQNFTVDVHLYVAIAANQTMGLAPLAVQFSSSVLGGSDYAYNWTFGNGQHSLLPNPIYIFPVGNYTVHFSVTSANGATGSENLSVESLPPPVAFSYTPTVNGTILSTFNFTATPNWDAAGPYSMSWSFPNGQTLTGMNVSYKFPVYNEFNTVIATFTYGNGKTWTQDLNVRLYPAPIKAEFSVPKIVPVDTLLNVTGTALDPDSSQITYTWLFNGQTYYGRDQFFYFGSAGNYSISLTVTDNLGASASYSAMVNAENVSSNPNIVINVKQVNNGPYTTYSIQVLSSASIDIVEAFLGSQSLSPVLVNTTDGYHYNMTLDQENYAPGSYPLKIVVFTTNGASNYKIVSFFVSQQYGKGGAPFNLASFFGGTLPMILSLLSITVGIASAVIFWRDKKDKDTVYFNVGGTIVKGKKTPLSKFSFGRHEKNVSQAPPPPPQNQPPGNGGGFNGGFNNNGGGFL